MSDNKKEILSNLNKDTEQEKLLQYLNRNMSDAEQHVFEKQIIDDEFMNDAVEGLQSIKDKKNIEVLIQQLNGGLKKQLKKRKDGKQKRKITEQPFLYFSILLILLLIITAYLVIKKIG